MKIDLSIGLLCEYKIERSQLSINTGKHHFASTEQCAQIFEFISICNLRPHALLIKIKFIVRAWMFPCVVFCFFRLHSMSFWSCMFFLLFSLAAFLLNLRECVCCRIEQASKCKYIYTTIKLHLVNGKKANDTKNKKNTRNNNTAMRHTNIVTIYGSIGKHTKFLLG